MMGKGKNCVSKSDEKALKNRINLYVANGANPKVMAAESGVGWSLFQKIMDGKNSEGVTSLSFRKLSAWMDEHPEHAPKVKRCSKCGKVKPLNEFFKDAHNADGYRYECKTCNLGQQRQKRKVEMNAITKELVEQIKSEDKLDIESKYMAAYFGITPAIMDDIRAGKHDDLLLTPQPQPEETATDAVNALREELNRVERKVDRLLLELGVTVG